MIDSFEKEHKDFRLLLKSSNDGQAFLTVCITNKVANPIELFEEVYNQVAIILKEYKISVFHERIFGSVKFYEDICIRRNSVINKYSLDHDMPFTYLDGSPHWGEGISGVNIHGVVLESCKDEIKSIKCEGKVCGRIWSNNNSECIMLHSIYGLKYHNEEPYKQTLNMFEKANCILKANGFEFKNVIRTWVYLNNILNQYTKFNEARNLKFKEFKLIPNEVTDNLYEQIYIPASTGISCNNVFESSGVMDVFAVKKKDNSCISIFNDAGNKQKSAYRYGSAFSRSMVIENNKSKYIYLSGTASINDKGETVFVDDIENQIEMTKSVIEALLEKESFNLSNICEGTVFLKKAKYISEYERFCQKYGLIKLPCVITVADVCRDDLLFEVDATFVENKE